LPVALIYRKERATAVARLAAVDGWDARAEGTGNNEKRRATL